MKNLLIPIVAVSLLSACGNSNKVDNKKEAPRQSPQGGQAPMPPNPNGGGGGQPPGGPGNPKGPGGPGNQGGGSRPAPKTPQKNPEPSEPVTPQEVPSDNTPSTTLNLNYGNSYSGAGEDGFRSFLKAKLDGVSNPDANLLNQAAAINVHTVRSLVNPSNGEVIVALTFKDFSNEVFLTGTLQGSKAKLTLSEGQQFNESIVGMLTCLDQDQNSCATNHLRLKIGQSPNAAYVHILVRKTSARIRASLPESAKGDAAFDKLLKLMKDTGKKIAVDSFEVINGRSAVTVSIAGSNNEVILGMAPLLKPIDDNDTNTTNILMSREIDLDYLTGILGVKPQLNIQKSISDMRLVSNDGKRTLGVKITAGRSQLIVGVVRVAPALRSPEESISSEAL